MRIGNKGVMCYNGEEHTEHRMQCENAVYTMSEFLSASKWSSL